MSFCELQISSNFSFLRGASHPEEMVDTAADLGYRALAITDRNSMAGIVRGHVAAKKKGIRLLPACRLDLQDAPSLLAYPMNKPGYAKLCTLLTLGNLRTEKGSCLLYRSDLEKENEDIQFALVPPRQFSENYDFAADFYTDASYYRELLGNRLSLVVACGYEGQDAKRLFRLQTLSKKLDMPLLASNDVYYHAPDRRQLQDVLTCVREKTTIQQAGYLLHRNAERHLKAIHEMKRLFLHYPDALKRSLELEEICQFSLDSLEYVYPEEIKSPDRTAQEELVELTWKGANERFPEGIAEKTRLSLEHELNFVQKKNYASYFLTVYDIVRFARSQNILCQGRGSAANSSICYCLGITSVNPNKFDLLFERFLSAARDEPPDIDVDFEHERREEVIQYIYNKYGRDRAAIVATVTELHQKGAIRDVGKAMGLSVDAINRLAESIWHFSDEWFEGKKVREQGMNPQDPHLRKVLDLTRQMMGFPRQLGQHTGGFVISQHPLTQLCPVLNARMENRTCIEWNKDDIEDLRFMKVDVLGLGMLTCIRKAFDLAKSHYGLEWTLANIPQDVPAVYDMICAADTLGVFQIESRAQQTMLPRLKPREFYDLVIEVAIVRPGPIQGDMVHPYLRRREGKEPVEYPSQALKEILERTKGVPLFQEQAMKIAIVAAGFSPTEADGLRRSMATFKAKGKVNDFETRLIKGMLANGYTEEFAKRIFRQLEGFGSYGFPESHAVSFALLVYISSWIKCFHPDIFATALLNSMPMGFYQPAQIINDAVKHGVEVRPVDINFSSWDNVLEEIEADRYSQAGQMVSVDELLNRALKEDTNRERQPNKIKAVRLGFRQVKGLKEEDIQTLVKNRAGGYRSMSVFWEATRLTLPTLEKIADADAFRSIGLDRRQALWEIAAYHDRPVALFKEQQPSVPVEKNIQLPLLTESENVVLDYAATDLTVRAHPLSFIRDQLNSLRILPAAALKDAKDGDLVRVAGLVLVRQRPGTASGICFITLEDETGFSNLVVFAKLFETFRKPILQSKLLMVEGKLQIEGAVIHVVMQKCYNLNQLLNRLVLPNREEMPLLTLSKKDERTAPMLTISRDFK